MKRIGILGGTFDPIHCGHIVVARYAMEQYELSEVRFMTGGNPPHKRRRITDAVIRHEMVKIAVENEPGFMPFDYEVYKKTYSYTSETITELKKKFRDTEIYFIIGEDSLRDLPKWHEPEIIVKQCVLLVYPRGVNSEADKLIDERKAQFCADIRRIDAPLMGMSSSGIRERIFEGKSVYGLVPDSVNKYIKEKNLYR